MVNYTEYEVPYTRIIEHKHFEYGTQDKTVITKEYPDKWTKKKEPYYPINNEKIILYTKNIKNIQRKIKILYLVEDLDNTNIMIWIKL